MIAVPRHTSWETTVGQIRNRMLQYQASDDEEIYSCGEQQIDVPLPFQEFIHNPPNNNIRCYEATAATGDHWPPCPGEYLVMTHPLMINGFTMALGKEKVLREFYDGDFRLPEERFVSIEIDNYGFPDYDQRFRKFFPKLERHYIQFRNISVIYGLYAPYRQDWVNNAAPRKCFFIDQFIYDQSGRSDAEWDYTNALLRFDFMPEVTDLLRRHEDKLIFPTRGCAEKIGFNATYSSFYVIVESPEREYNHDWM